MERMEAIQWVLSVTIGRNLSQVGRRKKRRENRRNLEFGSTTHSGRTAVNYSDRSLSLKEFGPFRVSGGIATITRLVQTALHPVNGYAQRMTIEELFRDAKSRRNGPVLRNIQIKSPDRVDRLLLIIALARLLLCGIGLRAKQKFGPLGGVPTTVPTSAVSSPSGKR